MNMKDFRNRVYDIDANSVGPAILAGLVHMGDDFDYQAVSYHDETQVSLIDYEIAVCGGGKLARFAALLRDEDKALCYRWIYGATSYTATERDTLNRLANKVRAESV